LTITIGWTQRARQQSDVVRLIALDLLLARLQSAQPQLTVPQPSVADRGACDSNQAADGRQQSSATGHC
jgi:hypothetical protein